MFIANHPSRFKLIDFATFDQEYSAQNTVAIGKDIERGLFLQPFGSPKTILDSTSFEFISFYIAVSRSCTIVPCKFTKLFVKQG